MNIIKNMVNKDIKINIENIESIGCNKTRGRLEYRFSFYSIDISELYNIDNKIKSFERNPNANTLEFNVKDRRGNIHSLSIERSFYNACKVSRGLSPDNIIINLFLNNVWQ